MSSNCSSTNDIATQSTQQPVNTSAMLLPAHLTHDEVATKLAALPRRARRKYKKRLKRRQVAQQQAQEHDDNDSQDYEDHNSSSSSTATATTTSTDLDRRYFLARHEWQARNDSLDRERARIQQQLEQQQKILEQRATTSDNDDNDNDNDTTTAAHVTYRLPKFSAASFKVSHCHSHSIEAQAC
jgi:hypothetical protein